MRVIKVCGQRYILVTLRRTFCFSRSGSWETSGDQCGTWHPISHKVAVSVRLPRIAQITVQEREAWIKNWLLEHPEKRLRFAQACGFPKEVSRRVSWRSLKIIFGGVDHLIWFGYYSRIEKIMFYVDFLWDFFGIFLLWG